MFDKIERIIKLLKPKYYDGITYFLVGTGASLVTKPIWLDILNSIILANNKNNEALKLNIIGSQLDPLVGLIVIAGALYWNTHNRLIDLKNHPETQPAYLSIRQSVFETFEMLCENIYPLINDNEYIFKTVGPNSGQADTEELRTDLTMWNKYKVTTIVPNNSKIKMLLKSNSNLYSRAQEDIINKMILHIDAFEEHCQNAEFDYSNFRFPTEFKSLIEDTCHSSTINSKTFLKRKKWLAKRLLQIKVTSWSLIGSSLFIVKTAKDMDLVLLSSSNDNNLHEKISRLKMDYKLKFKQNLHDIVFLQNEQEEYQAFLGRNKYKIISNG